MPLSLTDLPYTIFTAIIAHLSPTQTILCRRLCRAFLAALTRNDLCISLILAHFPRSHEGRRLRKFLKSNNLAALESGDWAAVFATLARRYYHLGNALPWKVERVTVLKDEDVLRGVAPWERHLSLNGKTAPFHFWDPVWTVAPGEGLLVYPAAAASSSVLEGGEEREEGRDVLDADDAKVPRYRARDLQTEREVDVPFDLRGKIVRRVRISHGVLVFEWCEQEPIAPDEAVSTHRHYASVYSVRRTGSWDGVIPRREDGGEVGDASSRTSEESTWEFELRCEFRIHPLGFYLDHQERFFSTHNATHYVVYTWQPWPNAEPIESLTIWELGPPSSSTPQPSQQPSESATPPPEHHHPNTNNPSSPRIIRKMHGRDLRDLSLRQSHRPALRAMALDDCTWDAARSCACGHVFFTEEEHRWSAGPHSSAHPPRLHRVKTTGIPLVGQGPRWVDDCGGGGGVNLRFCWRGRWRRDMTEAEEEDGVTFYDDDDDNDEGGSAGNDDGGIAWSPERAWSHSQTWPGRAPCWRHDDFPYVTLSEVFDAAAGVRVIARDCFMLETLSVHIRPKIRVQGVGSNGAKLVSGRRGTTDTNKTTTAASTSTTASTTAKDHASSSSRQTHKIASKSIHGAGSKKRTITTPASGTAAGGTTTQGPDGHEVQFADAMWSEMMGKGFICGDERWLVGEDTKGDVTILVF